MFAPSRPVERSDLPPREGVWFANPRPVRRTLGKMPNGYAWLWTPSVTYRMVFHGTGLKIPAWAFYTEAAGWLLLFVLGAWWKVSEALVRRGTGADRAFSERPHGLTEYPVEVIVSVDGAELGMDRGIVWFEDGLLRFNGAATSFALARTDFLTGETQDRKRSHQKTPPLSLWLRTGDVLAYVQFLPLTGWRNLGFGYVLGRFLGERTAEIRSRQWPPLRPYGEPSQTFSRPTMTPEGIGQEAARTGSAVGVIRLKQRSMVDKISSREQTL